MDAAFAALRDAFADCVQAGRCTLCGRALVDEAHWIDGEVRCPDCGIVHAPPGAPRCHAVWTPAARLLLATDAPDLDGGP